MKLQNAIKKYCKESIDKKQIINKIIEGYNFTKNEVNLEEAKK